MNKVVVIGLDGAPFPLIQKWVNSGDLPNLAQITNRGSFGVLRSTIPVHSPTAWSTFITGLNPGKHGVYDFVRREPESYRLRVTRSNQIAGASLWHLLSTNGRKVGIMNVPMTYPPEEVNGFLISGLGTPDYVSYTYPPSLSQELNSAGYRVNKKFFYDPERIDEWLEDLHQVSELRGKIACQLMRDKTWDFFMVVFRNTDEICHFFWRHMDSTHPEHDPGAPEKYKSAILDLYRRVDHWVGEIRKAAGNDTNIIVMSDHGAGPLYKDVFINEWLLANGWLKLKEEPPKRRLIDSFSRRTGFTRKQISDALTRLHLHRLEVLIKRLLGDRIYVLPRDDRPEFSTAIDWSDTKAYSFGYYGQIFINLKGREPAGIVDPGQEYTILRQEIAQKLYELIDPEDSQGVVDRVFFKEELFDGPYLNEAPDLLAIMRDLSYITRKGYEFAQERGVLFRKPYTNESGSHRIEGILIGSGPDLASIPDLPDHDIQDLTPTLLHLMRCPIPDNMDGLVMKRFLTEGYMAQNPIQYTSETAEKRDDSDDDWDDQAEAEITERLKNLGYLG